MVNPGDAIQNTQRFLNRYSGQLVEARTEAQWGGITEYNFSMKFCSEKDWLLMIKHIDEGLRYKSLIDAAKEDEEIANLLEQAEILKQLKGL